MKKFMSVIMLGTVLMSGCAKEVPPPTADATTPNVTAGTEEITELVPEEGAELTYWALREDFARDAAQRFEAEYGVPVNVEIVGFEAIQKLGLEGPAGNAADVVWGKHEHASTVYNAGLVLPIDPQITARLQDNVLEASLVPLTVDGNLCAVPHYMDSLALFYNKDLIDTPATTFEQIMSEAPSFNDPDNNKFYYMTVIGGSNLHPYLSAAGFELFGPDGTDNENPGFDTPEFLEGLKNIRKLGEILPVNGQDIRMSATSFVQQNFMDGNVAYLVNGPWFLGQLNESGLNYGITLLPSIDGNPAKPFSSVTGNFINAFTEYPIAAQLFAEFLTTLESAEKLYTIGGDMPIHKDAGKLPVIAESIAGPVFIEQFENTVPQPAVSRMSYFWSIAESIYLEVFDGTMTPEDAQAKMISDYEALLASE